MYLRNPDFSGMTIASLPGQKNLIHVFIRCAVTLPQRISCVIIIPGRVSVLHRAHLYNYSNEQQLNVAT